MLRLFVLELRLGELFGDFGLVDFPFGFELGLLHIESEGGQFLFLVGQLVPELR